MRCVALVLAATVAATASGGAQPADWTVKRDPFDRGVVERYKAILARDPYDSALAPLVAMYKKHRTLAQLDGELGDDWSAIVVRARIAGTAELWRRALALDEHDARAWLALGDVVKGDEARAAFERAATEAKTRTIERAALRKLVDHALASRDIALADRAFGRLLALDPNDGKLWLERGNALLDAKQYASALSAFATAEPLFAHDPEARVALVAQRGHALAGAGNIDKALAEYERAIALSPKGYYLADELVQRMVALHRDRKTLRVFIAALEQRWPVKQRRYFEWKTLGELYEETRDLERAVVALRAAVAKSPIELATQRRLVALLDRVGGDGLAQLEAAARAAPGDVTIQIELAERYWHAQPKAAIATLSRLAKTVPRHVGARTAIAEVYAKWQRPDLAAREWEQIVKLEPTEDNIVKLGEQYWVAEQAAKATAAWNRLARAGTAAAYARLGAVLEEHELADEAIAAYSQAIKREPKNAELWHARARIHESAKHWGAALADAETAVALIGTMPKDPGHAIRYQLVRLVIHADEDQHWNQIVETAEKWHAAFDGDPPDIAAGYMLAEFYGRQPSASLENTLSRLHQLVPSDRGVVIELIRANRAMRHYDLARQFAQELARAEPTNQELAKLLAQIDDERRRAPKDPYIEDPDAEIRRAAARNAERYTDGTPVVDGGLRIGIGTGLRGAADQAFTVGGLARFGSGIMQFVARLDWAQRAGDMKSVSAIAFSAGVSGRVVTTRNLAIALGAAQRIEGRYGDDAERGSWEQAGFAADATLDLIARNWPATFGARFEQGLSEHARNSALYFEIGVELR